MRIVTALTTAVLLSTAVAHAAPPVSDAQIAKIAEPERQLRAMIAASFFEDPAGPQSFYTLGIAPGCAVLKPAVERAVAANRVAWSANLVSPFRSAVPADTLATFSTQTPEGAGRILEPLRPAIGAKMQASSEAILQAASRGVIGDVQAVAAKVDPAQVDRVVRQRELEAAAGSDQQFCGLLPAQAAAPGTPGAPPAPAPPR